MIEKLPAAKKRISKKKEQAPKLTQAEHKKQLQEQTQDFFNRFGEAYGSFVENHFDLWYDNGIQSVFYYEPGKMIMMHLNSNYCSEHDPIIYVFDDFWYRPFRNPSDIREFLEKINETNGIEKVVCIDEEFNFDIEKDNLHKDKDGNYITPLQKALHILGSTTMKLENKPNLEAAVLTIKDLADVYKNLRYNQ